MTLPEGWLGYHATGGYYAAPIMRVHLFEEGRSLCGQHETSDPETTTYWQPTLWVSYDGDRTFFQHWPPNDNPQALRTYRAKRCESCTKSLSAREAVEA